MRKTLVTIIVAVFGLLHAPHAAEFFIQQGLVVLVDCKEVPEQLCANKGLRKSPLSIVSCSWT